MKSCHSLPVPNGGSCLGNYLTAAAEFLGRKWDWLQTEVTEVARVVAVVNPMYPQVTQLLRPLRLLLMVQYTEQELSIWKKKCHFFCHIQANS